MTTLYHWMAAILAGCWAVTHNYALAIALLTVAVVAVTTPLTWKSTRGMLAMQMLAPEIKKLQQKYKGDKEALNREMMALYKENSINPLGGCLPLLPQMAVFYVLYRTIYNLAHRITFTVPKGGSATQAAVAAHCPSLVDLQHKAGATWTCAAPSNVSVHSGLYHSLIASGGHMKVWGLDLTLGVRTAHGGAVVGYWILVALVVVAYYIQTRQMSSRNPAAAAANPQMQTMQKIFPLFFGFISITIQAAVNIYFLISALCRIGQQALMYRHDPVLRRHVEKARMAAPVDAASRAKGSGERKGFFASLLPPAPPPPPAKGPSGGKAGVGRPSGGRPSGGRPPAGQSRGEGRRGGGDGSPAAEPAGTGAGAGAGADRPAAPGGTGGEGGAPRGTLARLWAAASGAAPPSGAAPGTKAPPDDARGAGPQAPASGASGKPSGGTGAPRAQGNGSGPSGPARNGRNGAANRAPRPNQSNRSRAKRSRRPR